MGLLKQITINTLEKRNKKIALHLKAIFCDTFNYKNYYRSS